MSHTTTESASEYTISESISNLTLSDDEGEEFLDETHASKSKFKKAKPSKTNKTGLYPSALSEKRKKKIKLTKTTAIVPPSDRADPDDRGYYFLCNLRDIPIKKGVKAKINKKTLAVFMLADGTVHAIANACTHQGVSLYCGEVVDVEDITYVKCPGHNVKFDISTGKAKRGKWKQKAFSTRVKRDELWVKV